MMINDATEWWQRVRRTAPTGLAGLWFGMVELVPGGWHLYVAGTDTFDAETRLASGPYAWWPSDGYFPFPEVGNLDVLAAVGRAAEVVTGLQPWRDVGVRGIAGARP